MSDYNARLRRVIRQAKRVFFKRSKRKSRFPNKFSTELKDLIHSHEQELMEALKNDLNKSEFDAYITEIGIL